MPSFADLDALARALPAALIRARALERVDMARLAAPVEQAWATQAPERLVAPRTAERAETRRGVHSTTMDTGPRRRTRWSALLLAALLAVAAAQDATPADVPQGAPPDVWIHGARPQAPTASHVLDVLTFNTALLPSIAARTRQGDRAAVMAPHLVGYDVLVLQELFDDRLALPLLEELAPAYPYRTERVGHDGARRMPWRQDGGVVILSRWPIEREAQMTFDGACSGTDCLADKGVAYAAVRKGDRLYHVFGTHAQSVYGSGVAGVRATQFALLRAFVDVQGIPVDEPVVLAGDFNVDAGRPELGSMLEVLRAVRPPTEGPERFTWDPAGNVWADHRGEWLDYVLYAADHAAPVAAWNRAVPLRHEGLDLSDHYAVWGRLVMAPR